MPDLTPLYRLIGDLLPFDTLQARFMQQAMVGLLLLAPMAAALGVQVVNFRMAFFSDAISHSAFAGVALGLLFSIHPHWSMPLFGLLVGLGIMAVQRRSALSSDTVIGVFFSGVVAFGLAVVSRDRSAARNMQQFLYGDILTIGDAQVWGLILLFLVVMAFQVLTYNRLLYVGLHATLARAHGIQVAVHQYVFAGLLSLVVMFAVAAVGVLLVTALMVVPAAAARNLSRSAGAMFWWALIISLTSGSGGLVISAQPWARTATGATVILVACLWFVFSIAISSRRGNPRHA